MCPLNDNCSCHEDDEPRRIQLRRVRGWRKPEGAIVVSRPTFWGNPFKPGDDLMTERWRIPFGEVFGPVVRDQAHAVEIFACYARVSSGYEMLARHKLAGRDLACWCKSGDPCHADVLLKIANSREPAPAVVKAGGTE